MEGWTRELYPKNRSLGSPHLNRISSLGSKVLVAIESYRDLIRPNKREARKFHDEVSVRRSRSIGEIGES